MKTRLLLLLAGALLAVGAVFAQAPTMTTTEQNPATPTSAVATTVKTIGTLNAAGDGSVNLRLTEGTAKISVDGYIWADANTALKFTAADEKTVKKIAGKFETIDGFDYSGFKGEVAVAAVVPAPAVVDPAAKPAEAAALPAPPAYHLLVVGKAITVTAVGIGKVMMIGNGKYTTVKEGAKRKPTTFTWFVKPIDPKPADAVPVPDATDTKPVKVPQPHWVYIGSIQLPKVVDKVTPVPTTTEPAKTN